MPEVISVDLVKENYPGITSKKHAYRVTFLDDGETRKRYMFADDELQAYTAFKDYWREMYG
jgi:hypothetical protein